MLSKVVLLFLCRFSVLFWLVHIMMISSIPAAASVETSRGQQNPIASLLDGGGLHFQSSRRSGLIQWRWRHPHWRVCWWGMSSGRQHPSGPLQALNRFNYLQSFSQISSLLWNTPWFWLWLFGCFSHTSRWFSHVDLSPLRDSGQKEREEDADVHRGCK